MNKAQRKQAAGRVNRIHRQCHECVKFIDQHCKGKAPPSTPVNRWGTLRERKLSGLDFCKDYEFDERLYVQPDKMPTFKTIKKEAVVKHKSKKKQKAVQEHADLVDMAAGLDLKDLEHLL